MKTLKLRRIGNSIGAILPKEVLERLHVGEGDELFAYNTSDGVGITPYNPEFEESMEAFNRTRKKYRNALRKLSK